MASSPYYPGVTGIPSSMLLTQYRYMQPPHPYNNLPSWFQSYCNQGFEGYLTNTDALNAHFYQGVDPIVAALSNRGRVTGTGVVNNARYLALWLALYILGRSGGGRW